MSAQAVTGPEPSRRRARAHRLSTGRTRAAALVLTLGTGVFATGAASASPESGVAAASPVYVAQTASPASQPDWQARDWAMACMSCHNASAPVRAGEATLPKLEGRSEADLMTALLAMRDGRRSATLMPQLLKGYRDDELQRIVAYFASQPAAKAASASARTSR